MTISSQSYLSMNSVDYLLKVWNACFYFMENTLTLRLLVDNFMNISSFFIKLDYRTDFQNSNQISIIQSLVSSSTHKTPLFVYLAENLQS